MFIMDKIRTKSGALKFLVKFASNLMLGLFSVLTGWKKGYKSFSRRFRDMFPEPTREETEYMEAHTPPNMRWWAAEERDAAPGEAVMDCRFCGRKLGEEPVKECPNCGLVLHSKCYDRPYESYETEGCPACHERCYVR